MSRIPKMEIHIGYVCVNISRHIFLNKIQNISGNVPEMFRKFSGNVPDIFRKCSGNIPEMFRKCSGFLSGKVPEMFRNMFRKISGTFPDFFRKISGTIPLSISLLKIPARNPSLRASQARGLLEKLSQR